MIMKQMLAVLIGFCLIFASCVQSESAQEMAEAESAYNQPGTLEQPSVVEMTFALVDDFPVDTAVTVNCQLPKGLQDNGDKSFSYADGSIAYSFSYFHLLQGESLDWEDVDTREDLERTELESNGRKVLIDRWGNNNYTVRVEYEDCYWKFNYHPRTLSQEEALDALENFLSTVSIEINGAIPEKEPLLPVPTEAHEEEITLSVQDENGTIEAVSLSMSCTIPAGWYQEENGNYRYDNGYKAAEGFRMELLEDGSLDWEDFWTDPDETKLSDMESQGRKVLVSTVEFGFKGKSYHDKRLPNSYFVRMEHEKSYLSFNYYPKEPMEHEAVLNELQIFLDSITLGELKIEE